ncbi:MAG: hypothetical protein RL685_117 [Pseudomonadota bacterium]
MLVCAPRAAAAAELALEQPAACVTLDELSFRVERLLGQPLANVEAMQVLLRVEAEGTGFVARLELTRPGAGEGGMRSLRAASCAELAESLAIAIVVAIGDVEPVPEPASPAQPSAAPPAAGAQPASSAAPGARAAAEPERESEAPTFTGAAWAMADSGTLPASTIGAGVGLGLAWSTLELRAIGTFLPEREGRLLVSDARSPGVSIGLLAGSMVACVPVALQGASLRMAVCGGAELGQLSGAGTRVSMQYHRRALWAAARFELVARLALAETPFGLELLVTALAPFTRDEFILRDLGEVHRSASVVGRLGLGLWVAVD